MSQGRLSPVLDEARRGLVIAYEGTTEVSRQEVRIEAAGFIPKARCLTALHPEVLICGAISWPLEALLASAGVQVISNRCGPVEEIIKVFLSGQLEAGSFLMPGCCRKRRRFRAGRR